MIDLNQFYFNYKKVRYLPNQDQKDAIEQKSNAPLFIVAGPGTGKTTCLTLRILKLIFVDGISPEGILATTFTKKAAEELRSRILSWGFRLIEEIEKDATISKKAKSIVSKLDINQVLTGTIDSICEQLLQDYRDPGTQPPILIDGFVGKTLLLREGLFNNGRYKDSGFDKYLFDISGRASKFGWHIGAKNDLLQTIWDRRVQDQVDWSKYIRSGSKSLKKCRDTLDEAFIDYETALTDRLMVDFTLLEQQVLERLQNNKLVEFQKQIEVVLVDEYQDTNLLQECIYYELAKSCNGALNVVGDDDQSLYRFRGATVELFSDFDVRYKKVFKKRPKKVFLKTNYRSTKKIIEFTNQYATLDPDYQQVRVKSKPDLKWGPKAPQGIPILGMFREDLATLSEDLTDFITDIFRMKGFKLPGGKVIKRDSKTGDIGDCCLLCSSPKEGNEEKARLPLLMRESLQAQGIDVFNPRGQDLNRIEIVRIFGGLLLECLDTGGIIEADTSGLSRDMQDTFAQWREDAINYANDKKAPKGLLDFAVGWADRDPKQKGWKWPKSTSVLDLIYGLNHFFPELYDDPEGQIYLEVFTRQASACEQIGKFKGRVVHNPSKSSLSEASIKELLRNFLGPIAGGSIDINDDLMDSFPRDRLNILSIHQSKGLEFPLTIVDVGSDFKTNHAGHRFKRFPKTGGTPHALEDLLRKNHPGFSTLNRSAQDRAFDDLYRQFFVAYSRAQEVLLLVGVNGTYPGNRALNVATGWQRNEYCAWNGDVPFLDI
jgi:ATP-dependent DNA helicase UvrD/PcrA